MKRQESFIRNIARCAHLVARRVAGAGARLFFVGVFSLASTAVVHANQWPISQSSTGCLEGDAKIMDAGAEVSASDCLGVLLGERNASMNHFDNEALNREQLNGADADEGDYILSEQLVPWDDGAFGTDGWEEQAKIENNFSAGATGDGLSFKIVSRTPDTGGTITELEWSSTPLTGNWIVRVKQSNMAVLWLFKNLQAATGGTVTLSSVGDGISNLSLISGRESVPPDETEVPSPATWLLIAPALMLLRKRLGASR